MSVLAEMLSPDFLLHHALYGSVIVGLVCPLVGVYLFLRRRVFWGVALPQVSAAGISFALMLEGWGLRWLAGSEGGERHMAIAGAVIFTGLAIFALSILERKKSASDGFIGALYAAAAAAAILFVSWNAAGEAEMLGLMKGEIVAISESDFHAMFNAFLLAAGLLFLFRKEFLLVSYDADMALTLGRNVLFLDALLFVIFGLVISLGTMNVGPLVTFGFLVLPPLAAHPWSRSMGGFSTLSSLIGGACALAGFYAAFVYDLPLGPIVTMAAFFAVLLSYAAAGALKTGARG